MSVQKLNQVVETVKSRFIAREDVIESAALSLITGGNMLMVGKPGTAKSSVIGDFFAHMPGRKAHFNLTKGSTPQEILGVPSISAFKERERMEFAITDMAPDTEFLNIEEVFKANSLTRNALLQILNEHQFLNGGQAVPCPLIFCGASSNEFPEFNEDGAFYDRFILRHQVDYLSDHEQRMRMVRLSLARGRGLAHEMSSDLTLQDIYDLQEARSGVQFGPETDELSYHMYANLLDAGVQVGDRRFAESFRVAQAHAVLKGRDVLVPDDLLVFMHTVWTDPNERKVAQDAVLRTISPETADMTQMFDELEDGFRKFLEEVRGEEDHGKKMISYRSFVQVADPQLHRMDEAVTKIRSEQRDAERATELFARASQRLAEAAQLVLYQQP